MALDARRCRPRPRERALASAAAADGPARSIEAALSRTLAGRALGAGRRERPGGRASSSGRRTRSTAAARRGYRDAAERELRKLGRRAHRRTRPGTADGTGIDTLTERERQVAALVVDRRTNAEIAAELFLSLKTVETHLRNIFRKLGVSSRVEVARAVERAGRASGLSAQQRRGEAGRAAVALERQLGAVVGVDLDAAALELAVDRGTPSTMTTTPGRTARMLQPIAS